MKTARLLALGVLSIGLFGWVDDPLWRLLQGTGWERLAELRIPSLLLSLALALGCGGARQLLPPSQKAPWARLAALALSWLVPTLLVLLIAHPAPMVALPRLTDRIAHLGTGLLAEELLFRGALQPLASRVTRPPIAILISSLCFALSHLQHHSWQLNASLPQLAITFGMGIVLGWLALASRSLWPPAVVHAINNTVALVLTAA